jgi:uncharacterized membrane protein YoaK (UPF0700 family)
VSGREGASGVTIGKGEKWALAVVALFLAGMAVGGVAVHNFMNAHGYYLPTAAALLLMLLACALAAVRSGEETAGKK